jgi:predicted Zn-dependent protease
MRRLPRPSRRPTAALLLAAGLGFACTTVVNPVTGKSEWSTMSPEREVALGRQAAAQVQAEMGLVDDPALSAYVDQIGQRLARHSPRQDVAYHFAVADMAEPNAFALPGGWIYVSRGLLVITNSEAELANVIGHEIGHVAARHAAQRETRAAGVGILSALGTAAAGAVGGGTAAQAVGQLGQVAGAGYIASYGRDQERQSDEVGQGLTAAAGWDPAAMAEFLDTLDQESVRQMGQPRLPTFLDSHPVTAERVRDTRARASSLSVQPAAPIARDRSDFIKRLDGLLVGPDPAEGVFQEALFLHPGLDFALEFPPGWATVNSKQAVAAQSPGQDAVIALEVQGQAGDPGAAAQAFAQQNRIELLDPRAGRIGGYDAYRARALAQSQQGRVALDLTWIAHPAGVFRMTGMTSESAFQGYEPALSQSALSFRALRRAERNGIREKRLHSVRAKRGETLASLGQRTGSAWSVEQTAVANAISPAARLEAGRLVKIAVELPYRPDAGE